MLEMFGSASRSKIKETVVNPIFDDIIDDVCDLGSSRERSTTQIRSMDNSSLMVALEVLRDCQNNNQQTTPSSQRTLWERALHTKLRKDQAAVLIQRAFRVHESKKIVRVKKRWDLLRNACRPMMKQRVSELRDVYDKCGLVDKQDWVTAVDLEQHASKSCRVSYTIQRVLMFVVPLFSVSAWQFIPIAEYDEKWEDEHYDVFLIYYYFWLASCCLFFLPLYENIVEIRTSTVIILSAVFPVLVVSLHASLYVARGTAFWGSCLESSVVHLAVSVLGLVLIVGYVVISVLTKVRRAEAELSAKKQQFVNLGEIDVSGDGEASEKALVRSLSDLTKVYTIPDTAEYEEGILRHANSASDILNEVDSFHRAKDEDGGPRVSPKTKPESPATIKRRESVARIQRGENLARHKKSKQRRASMLHFDRHAKKRIEKAAHGFVQRKMKQVLWTTITIAWAAMFFWSLSLYTAFFVTYAHEDFTRLILTGVFHLMTKFFEVTCLVLAEEADVTHLQTYAPGHAAQALRANRNYDNYSLWRLSHRMSFAVVAYKRSFYVSLFAEATDIWSFLSMALASLLATVSIQSVVTSERFHNIVSKYLKRRTFASMAKEFRLNNVIDAWTTVLFYFIFVVFFIAAKLTDNKHAYPYKSHSSKNWDTIGFLGLYSVFTVIGCFFTYMYHQKVLPATDESDSLHLLFSLEDKKLFISVITILIHIGMDPYYSLAVNNMSNVLPCSANVSSGSSSTNSTTAS